MRLPLLYVAQYVACDIGVEEAREAGREEAHDGVGREDVADRPLRERGEALLTALRGEAVDALLELVRRPLLVGRADRRVDEPLPDLRRALRRELRDDLADRRGERPPGEVPAHLAEDLL